MDSASKAVGEMEMRLMLDSVIDTEIVMLDPQGIIRSWNRGAENLTGYRAAEAIGQSTAILYTEQDQRSNFAQQELEAAQAKGRLELEGWRVRKDGSRFWASVHLQPHKDSKGKTIGYVKIVRDMSDRARSEEKFRAVVESAPTAMVMIDQTGEVVLVNAQAEKLFRYTRKEMLGKKVEALIPRRFVDTHASHREQFFANPATRMMGVGRDLFGVRKDGSEMPVEIGLNPIETQEGRFVLAAIVDISERVERDRLLKRQRDEILELSTPVIQVWDKVLALPIIGTLDSQRAARLTENLLQKIASDEAEFVIVDISGVPAIDSQVAQNLLKTVQGARLMGAESIISGVRPETAQSMVHLGIDIGSLRSRATLRDALQLAIKLRRELAEKVADD